MIEIFQRPRTGGGTARTGRAVVARAAGRTAAFGVFGARRAVLGGFAAGLAAAWLTAASPAVGATADELADLPAADGGPPAGSDVPVGLLSTFDVLPTRRTGDLDAIVAARQIRMLVAVDRTHFYFDGGRPRGIVADAIAQFESWLNARLQTTRATRVHVIVVPVPRGELVPALLDGRGDLIATPLASTAERSARIAFASGGSRVDHVLVTRAGEPPVDGVEALSGRVVFVRAASAHCETLVALNARLAAASRPPVRIELIDENLTGDDVLQMVDAGAIPATVADHYVAESWSRALRRIRIGAGAELRTGLALAWAVRPDAPRLLDLVSAFQAQHSAGTLWGNVKAREYFGGTEALRDPRRARARLAQVRTLMQRYADAYSLDWLLVAAQAFQESGLDHSRRSRVGAVGIMQMMPATARDPRIGIPDVHRLDRNIEAGTKYLRFVMDRYYADAAMTPLDKALFALASYNAGPARVAKLRAEAERDGFDPNAWFDNVEIVASRRIGAETVDYVRNVYKYYLAYRLASEQYDAAQRLRTDAAARTRYPIARNAPATPAAFANTRG